MADLLEQIKNDRKAGTPGPWLIPDKSSLGCIENHGGEIIAETYGIGENCSGYDADARRIARVPEMETLCLEQAAKLEAAGAMATALSEAEQCMTETLDWSRDCGDPDAECPMQDAHQDDGMQGVRDRVSATLAAWKEANNE